MVKVDQGGESVGTEGHWEASGSQGYGELRAGRGLASGLRGQSSAPLWDAPGVSQASFEAKCLFFFRLWHIYRAWAGLTRGLFGTFSIFCLFKVCVSPGGIGSHGLFPNPLVPNTGPRTEEEPVNACGMNRWIPCLHTSWDGDLTSLEGSPFYFQKQSSFWFHLRGPMGPSPVLGSMQRPLADPAVLEQPYRFPYTLACSYILKNKIHIWLLQSYMILFLILRQNISRTALVCNCSHFLTLNLLPCFLYHSSKLSTYFTFITVLWVVRWYYFTHMTGTKKN